MTNVAVDVRDLSVSLSDGSASIIRDVSFTIEPGKILAVVGESGSGKSTLGFSLLGYARRGARISGGEVFVAGQNVVNLRADELRKLRRAQIAFVPQDPATALNPKLSLKTQLLEGLNEKNALEHVKDILEKVGLRSDDEFLNRKPRALSGGQQQRVAIAMAAARNPDLIVFDEPTTGLDVSTQARVLELVRALCTETGTAALYVTHDLAVVADLADEVLVMYGGFVVESGVTKTVIAQPKHPYTRALLAAVPSAQVRHRLQAIPGRAPAVGQEYSGCVFRDRCAFAVAACAEVAPPLVETSDGGLARCIRIEEVAQTPHTIVRDLEERTLSQTETPLFRVDSLRASYRGHEVLHGVDLQVARGESLAIVGESGSGKTTLSRCLIGLHSEYTGELEFLGQEVPNSAGKRSTEQRRAIQYIFQNPYGSLQPRRTIGQSMSLPIQHFFGVSEKDTRQRVADALERVELSSRLATQYPNELSGGQRQRVAIARALVCDPQLLICDEITSALDVSVQASIIELLRSLIDDGLSMLFVTHNLAIVRSIADSVLVLQNGTVVEAGTSTEVLDRPSSAYTQALMADTLDIPEPSQF